MKKKKVMKIFSVKNLYTGSIFLDNLIVHYDMTRFAGMGIIVVCPPGWRVKFLAGRTARATAETAHE